MLERLREVLDYNPNTGVMIWKVSTARRVRVGDEAGYRGGNGRMWLRVDNVRWIKARLAWFMHYGEMPVGDVDHIDGDPGNDRISNLRDVSHQENSHNVHKAFSHNTTGVLGAHKSGKRYRARISVDGESIWLGRFDTPEAANHAYLAAKRKFHGGCTI